MSSENAGSKDWRYVRDEILAVAQQFVTQLDGVTDLDQAIPKMTWTVRDLARHVMSLADLYTAMYHGTAPMPLPADMAQNNQTLIQAVALDDGNRAEFGATLLEKLGRLLDAWGDDGTRHINHWATTQPVSGAAGLVLNELLMHSLDLAELTGASVTITKEQALACLDGLLPAAVNFVDPVAARKAEGVFHLRVRGGDDWTQTVRDGTLTVTRSKPTKADFHVNADPVATLLVSQGRMSQLIANLTGKIIGYGRKPLRAQALSNIFTV